MDKISTLARFGGSKTWSLIASGLKNSTDPLDVAKGVWSETQLIHSAFEKAATAITDSVELSEIGKANELRKLGALRLEDIAKQRVRMVKVEEAYIEAVSKARTAEKTPEEKIASLLAQREIRDLLVAQVGNDQNALKIAYGDALDAGDFETCNAIENSPRLWEARPSADELETWKAARLEIEEPELSKEVGHLSAALNDCGNILDGVDEEIREVTGVRDNEGISTIADTDVGAGADAGAE